MSDRKNEDLFEEEPDLSDGTPRREEAAPSGFEEELFNTEIHELLGDLDAEGSQPVEAPELPTPSVEQKESLPPPPVPAATPPPEQRYQSARRLSRWWLYVPLLLAGLAGSGYAAWTFAIQPWLQEEPPGVDLGPLGLRVDSVPPGASVWLQLGQAPATSPVVSAGKIHRIQILHPSHPPRVVEVHPADFEERGGQRVATVRVDLTGAPEDRGGAEESDAPGGGRGRIQVETTPARALVWLEIGETPNARLSGLERWHGRKLLFEKEGHVPKSIEVTRELFGEDGWGRVRAALEPNDVP